MHFAGLSYQLWLELALFHAAEVADVSAFDYRKARGECSVKPPAGRTLHMLSSCRALCMLLSFLCPVDGDKLCYCGG